MLASCLQCKQNNWKLAVRLLTSKIGSCNMSLFSKCSANKKKSPPLTEGNRWGAYTAKCTMKLSTAGLLLGTKHIHITFDSGGHVQSKTQKKKLVGEGEKRQKEKYHTFNLSQHKQAWLIAHHVQYTTPILHPIRNVREWTQVHSKETQDLRMQNQTQSNGKSRNPQSKNLS